MINWFRTLWKWLPKVLAKIGLMSRSNLTHQNTFSNPRSTGYSIGGVRKTTLSYDAASGRLVGMAAGSDNFAWEYLAGTNLKSKLTYPNAATAEWTYEAERDLISRVKNTVNGNVISQYDYAHDALGRRTSAAKSGTMMAASENLAYGYNARSELVSAVSDVDANYNYAYAFDHIGNRATEAVAGTENAYATNSLNQYLSVTPAESPAFNPSYDADGNVTSVQTSTGTWNVEYNAENRPVRWTNAATGTVITMSFDSQGRRTEYKSVTNGAQNTWLRFLYDGYLCVQVLYSNEPYNVFKEFVWDPTEPVATRPLVFRYAPNSLNLFYAFDGNKNVSDVFYRMNSNGIGAHYDYAPFGTTTRTHCDSSASFDIVALNPFRFSSEYYDSELDLVYYNFRHYSPSLGRFLSRDPIQEQGGLNLYAFVGNNGVCYFDLLGNAAPAVLLPLGITISAAEAAAAVMGLSVAACLSDPTCRELALRYTQDGITEVLVKARQLACVAAYHEYHHLSCRKCSSRSPVMHSTLNCACWGHVVLWRSAYLSMKCDYFLEGSIKSPQGSIEKERGHQEQLENAIRAMKKCCENLCSDDEE